MSRGDRVTSAERPGRDAGDVEGNERKPGEKKAARWGVATYLVYVNALADAATQGTSLSVLLTFSQVGNLVAPVLGGWAIARFSWTAGFGFAAGLAVVGLVAIVLVPVAVPRRPTPA